VPDADIYYKDNWAQFRTEWRPFSNVAVRNNLQRLSTKRHWLNAERYVYQPASGSVLRSDFLEIFHLQRQYGNRTEAVITSEIAGRSNAVSVGFDYNWIRFEHQNNSPYGGSALVPVSNPGSDSFINLAGTFPKFRSLSHQVSFFAEDRLALGARVSLVGGVRVDRYDAERRDLVTGITYPKEVTPSSARGGIVYLVRPDLSLYAQYSTATDFIGNLITQSPVQQAFEPTTGRQIEVGSKQAFWNNRGEWTVAGYQIVKKKLLASNPDNPAQQIQIGQQSSVGVEASALLALMNAVRIEANITALRPRYDDFFENVGGVPTSRVGNTPPGVPQRAANLWITWSPLPQWQARGGVRIVGGRFANNANTDKIPSYTVIDAGLRRSLTDRVAVDLRLYNAFDKIYPITTYGGVNQWLLGRPRAVEVSLTTNF
jgi:iron complex outermembrane receptor protein